MERPSEIADVGHQFAPLGGEQVDHVNPFGLAFQQGGYGRKKVDVGIGCDPTPHPPGEHPLQFDDDLLGVGVDLDGLADWLDLESFGDFYVHLSQGQAQVGLPVDVGAKVGLVDEIGAIVLEPGSVGEPVPVDRGQVFAMRAVDVEFDRDRPAAGLFDDPQLHRPGRWRDRFQCTGQPLVFHLGGRHTAASGQVKGGGRVGGVFDQDFIGR